MNYDRSLFSQKNCKINLQKERKSETEKEQQEKKERERFLRKLVEVNKKSEFKNLLKTNTKNMFDSKCHVK
jgi:hypothetical protein